MNQKKMYSNLAKYYDIIHSDATWKDYKGDSQKIHKVIQQYKKTQGNNLLDVACGTGNHIKYLKRQYNITGLDFHKEMLDIARNKFPNIKFLQRDMTSFNLNKKYDIITCLFGSIAYAKTYSNLEKVIDCFSKHLKSGGVVIIEPFISPDKWEDGCVDLRTVDRPGLKISRVSFSYTQNKLKITDMRYTIATKDGIKEIKEKHETGLFAIDKFLNIMKNKGFKAKHITKGWTPARGLYICVKK